MVLKKNSTSDPEEFIRFFDNAVKNDLCNYYAAPILEGVAMHLAYRFCNYIPPENWNPKHPLPEKSKLVCFILSVIENHDFLWENINIIALALKSCAPLVKSSKEISSLFSYYLQLASHRDPEIYKPDIINTDIEFISQNSVRGNIAEGAVLLAVNLLKNNIKFPKLLSAVLLRFATDSHLGVRISILKHLTAYARFDPDKAWSLFHAACPFPDPLLWPFGENFLQDQYNKNFKNVKYHLDQARHQSVAINYKTWGISFGLSYLSGSICAKELSQALLILNHCNTCYEVFNILNIHIKEEDNLLKCVNGLVEILDSARFSKKILDQVKYIFQYLDTDYIDMTTMIAYKFISSFRGCRDSYDLSWFYNWLNRNSEKAPIASAQLCEQLISKIKASPAQCQIWQGKKYSQTLINIINKTKSRHQE
ncbi:hypothetical protein [Desulfonema limicola]|uniref:hypothetical protein n=1 Tax=Desulfonema limicola TaxID=45656 RepID=UPI001A9B50E1|nr:hypothetical protein [Desulfonema limicola]